MGTPTGDSLKCHKCVVNRLLLQYLGETHPNVTDCSQAAKRLSERGFMPKIGYARVSSSSQDLDIQNAKLVAAGCEVIRSETASGASRDDRFRASWANMDGGVVAVRARACSHPGDFSLK